MKMYQVDAFTQQVFGGNPAAVLILEEWLDNALMQKIAFENNLPDTAFVKQVDATHYQIRWFSPSVEVDFCGHATLASAFVLFQEYTREDVIYFDVKRLGQFVLSKAPDGKIKMDFPIRPAKRVTDYPPVLDQLLHSPAQNIYLNEKTYIVEYMYAQQVKSEQLAMALLQQFKSETTEKHGMAMGLALTAPDQDCDCVTRYFSANNGMIEDPVTGSIHTAIAPLWASKLHKTSIVAYQASSRGGVLYCEVKDQDRIEISGYAVLYMKAELHLDEDA